MAKNAKLIKVRCINTGSSSLADWYKEIALYSWRDFYWVTSREFNTMGEFLPTEKAFPKKIKDIESRCGKGIKYPSKFQAASDLLEYNWDDEEIVFKETHNTWGSLKDFKDKNWNKVDPHLKPSIEKLIVFHSPEKVTIDGKNIELVSIEGSTTKLGFLNGNLYSEWRPFMGGTYFAIYTSVNLKVNGWKIRGIIKDNLEYIYKK